MAHDLYFLYIKPGAASGTTVPITGDALLRYYVPQTPSTRQTGGRSSPWRNGAEIGTVTRENVVENIEITVTGATKTEVQTKLRQYENLMLKAEERQRKNTGDRVYLVATIDGDVTWRSEVLTGRVVLGDTALEQWANVKADATIIIERRWYWEEVTAHTALMTNTGTTTPSATVGIVNHNDSTTGHDNWVDVDDSSLGFTVGSLPAPARIVLEYTGTTSIFTRTFYAWTNGIDTSIPDFIEGETSTIGTTVADSTCSGGNKQRATWTGAQTAQPLFRFTLTSAQLSALRGNWYRLLARIPSVPTTAGLKLYVGVDFTATSPVNRLYTTGKIDVTTQKGIYDLGAIPLPPGAGDLTYGDMALTIYYDADSSGTVDLDYIVLAPADTLLKMEQIGDQLDTSDQVVIDGQNGTAVLVYASGTPGSFPVLTFTGRFPEILPGVVNRLYFLADEISSSNIDRAFNVSITYWGRRLTI